MAHVAEWSDLPPEMVGLILANCSVVELARVASTCRTFQAVYRRELRREQKVRHKLALEWFGRERIKCIADLVDRCTKGGPLNPETGAYGKSYCSILADGALHFEEEDFEPVEGLHFQKGGDIVINVSFDGDLPGSMHFFVEEPSFGEHEMLFYLSRSEGAHIEVDGDVRNVALVLALLTGDLLDTQADLPNPHSVLAPPFSDAAQPVTLEIHMKTETTTAWLALIAPLLPLASQYNFSDFNLCVRPNRYRLVPRVLDNEYVQPRDVESHANNGIMLRGVIGP